MFLGPPDELTAHELDGTITAPMACDSEGAIEVYIEPFLPAPQLVVVGRSPAVHRSRSRRAHSTGTSP